ncbi:DUF4166 domain-containing protein [Simplicispira hankyongi]|jgi:hypothetical protein|uniref:DUF4166 domain-containing protein n=1 Tax=Simplicispira hankyongi TaxID=2315688 RepID=A0A398CGV8_9BURK|nr:DUF4166 domain-containing protein [Simplicispira hankyongi]RID98946.1 DUF4166 domain-containing protein [Simplicispira hankyongi]
MKSLMQQVLGESWKQLPPGLKAHYCSGASTDVGQMDVEFPAFMQPGLWVLGWLGALVRRRGRAIATTVEKTEVGPHQYWRRTLCYPDGTVARFNSHWELAGGNQLIEYVNPWLGLQMAVQVQGGQLHYHGVRYVVRLGRLRLPIPEWLALGHTTIVETATGPRSFAMDFRLAHPLLGQVFRYSGTFVAKEGGR